MKYEENLKNEKYNNSQSESTDVSTISDKSTESQSEVV